MVVSLIYASKSRVELVMNHVLALNSLTAYSSAASAVKFFFFNTFDVGSLQ
eukprot:m.214273 g.214273  ORF g.214273 m.214273 type:complete len:51 (+) comp39808_c0_seq2:506-658(+)